MIIAVIGGGSWGTSFSDYLARLGHSVVLCVRESEVYESILMHRENKMFLPDIELSEDLAVTQDPKRACREAELVLMVTPSQYFRPVFEKVSQLIDCCTPVVSLTKGIEVSSLKFMSEIVEEILPGTPFACLSGPSFAIEVAQKKPTAVVVASYDPDLARVIQQNFSSEHFRIYVSGDIAGVECANSIKNVIAVAAGISDGLEHGDSARATLITRGLAEMARLGNRLGADPLTFAGLAGLGDLTLTCTSTKSRNYQKGLDIARSIDTVQATMVTEGIDTCLAAKELAEKLSIEMPITQELFRIIYEGKDPRQATNDLMNRPLRAEAEQT